MSIEQGRRVLEIEARAITNLVHRLDHRFTEAVDLLHGCAGKVVVSGMGKSGLIGQKIAATLASTGTPAFFLHPAEGTHGDLGMLARRDTFLALSNSGETEELLKMLPYVKRLSIPVIALTGRVQSTLAKNSEVILDVSVGEEACPLGLAPPPARPPPWRWEMPWRLRSLKSAVSKKTILPCFIPAARWDVASCSRYGI